jgi:hypothetical protein
MPENPFPRSRALIQGIIMDLGYDPSALLDPMVPNELAGPAGIEEAFSVQIRTTTDLRGLRLLLGLTPSEAASMIGEDKAWLRNIERGRNWNVPVHYAGALTRLVRLMVRFSDWVSETEDRFIIVYQQDDVFRDYDPDWFEQFPETKGSETVGGEALTTRAMWHLRAAAWAKLDLAGERDLTLVTLNPTSYREYLAGKAGSWDGTDTPDMRQRWAEAYCKSYRYLEINT